MKTKDILLYIWELPQNLVGLLLTCLLAPGQKQPYRDARILRTEKMNGGISLGRYIIVSSLFSDSQTELHEWGHTLQSRMLGPLYLPIIGLPSLLWAIWWKPGKKRSYFSFYTERWADRLAGIRRFPSSDGRKTPPQP
jgi:hypothetical protein